jgi:Ca-activated chloride channel family protein
MKYRLVESKQTFWNMKKLVLSCIVFLLLWPGVIAAIEDHPDELYQQGRFSEAEKAYAKADMDHPKDIRYRYNRGCAAYQNSDFDGAAAAFSSVLRRADDDAIRFKTLFNLGNASYKKGDFQAATTFYKKALTSRPSSEDARHNLEMSLRAWEKQEEKQKNQQKNQPSENSDKQEENEQEQKTDNPGNSQGDTDQEKKSQAEGNEPLEPSGKKQEKDQHKEADGKSAEKSPEKETDQRKAEGENAPYESPQDLSGPLEPMNSLPEQSEASDEKTTGASLDKRKAEAFLNNVKEDRSKFMQYRLGRRSVPSGKDW